MDVSCPIAIHPYMHANFMQFLWQNPVDQAIEEMMSKDTHTLEEQKVSGAVAICYLASKYRTTSYLRQLRDMIGCDSSRELNREDLQLSPKDESGVKSKTQKSRWNKIKHTRL